MKYRKTAYFIHRPRRLSDLLVPHLTSAERSYEIIATVELPKIDYENFCEDLLADRSFLEGYSCPSLPAKPLQCVLLKKNGQPDGILVTVYNRCFVKYAASYSG